MFESLIGRGQRAWYRIANHKARHILAVAIGLATGSIVLCNALGVSCVLVILGVALIASPVAAATYALLRSARVIQNEYDTGKLEAISRKVEQLKGMENEMVRMERDLVEQVARYEMVFKHVDESIYIINAYTCEIVDFNDAAAKTLGYTRGEFSDLGLSDIGANDTADDIRESCLSVVRLGCITFDTIHLSKDGELMPAICNSSLIRSNGDTFLQTICRYGE